MSLDKGLRYNENKPKMSLITPEFMEELAKVLTMGAAKYDKHNWLKGLSYEETYDSLMRHANAWLSGEMLDNESGLHHMAHVACNAMFLLTFDTKNTYQEFDDRPFNNKQENIKAWYNNISGVSCCLCFAPIILGQLAASIDDKGGRVHRDCYIKHRKETSNQ